MTDTALAPVEDDARQVVVYEPEKGLATIAVAETAEQHLGRSLRSGRLAGEELERTLELLLKAVDEKIDGQANYVVWRASLHPVGRPHKEILSQIVLTSAAPSGGLS